jgi:hypothetical protein
MEMVLWLFALVLALGVFVIEDSWDGSGCVVPSSGRGGRWMMRGGSCRTCGRSESTCVFAGPTVRQQKASPAPVAP